VLRHVRLELLTISCVLDSSTSSVKEHNGSRCCKVCIFRERESYAWPEDRNKIVNFSSLDMKQLIERFYPSYIKQHHLKFKARPFRI
jgi:hypothetical protein